MSWKENKLAIGMFSIMFIFMVLFFGYINLVVVYDGDDWCNLSYLRAPVPKWGIWNPIKVLPEILTPLAGHIAAYIANPILNNYIFAITLTTAFILALIITIYFIMYYRIAREKFNADMNLSCVVVAFMFGLHFLVFRSGSYSSQFMFSSCNLTCYYHYVIPNVLNAIMVMYLYLNDDFKYKAYKSFKFGLATLGIYLAIFSNVFSSIILATYVSFVLVKELLMHIRNKFNVSKYIKENIFYLIVLCVWFLSLIFEANGGRSKSIGVPLLALPIFPTLKAFKALLFTCNKYFIAYCVVLLGGFVCMWKYHHLKITTLNNKIVYFSLWGIIITGIYTILLCAKAGIGYIYRSDVVFGIFFYVFLLLHFILTLAVEKYPSIKVIVPLLTFVFLTPLADLNSFRHSTTGNVAPEKCVAIDNYLIQQIKNAANRGEKEMTLIVPKGDDNDNWPHPNYMGGNILKTLKAHGIIVCDMRIKIKADSKLNEKYKL